MTLHILLVDDEYSKAEAVVSALKQVDPSATFEHQSNARSARECLRRTKFDLMLIDVNLPDYMGGPIVSDAGFQLFDAIFSDHQIHDLPEMVFISAREDAIAETTASAAKRAGVFLAYSSHTTGWREALSAKARLLLRRRRAATRREVDVAIVTALRTPELEAVLKLPYGWTGPERFGSDPTGYHFGTDSRGPTSIVAAASIRKGMASAAALAARMVERYKPKLVVMLGICAGIKGKADYGDIVVADPSWDWGSGKQAEEPSGSLIFKAAPYQSPLDARLSELARDLGQDAEILTRIRSQWPASKPSSALRVHVAPMASGASVVAHQPVVDEIAKQNRDLVAVEMEAYAVMAAAEGADARGLVIKSVCDFADATKADEWQPYAAHTSACFFHELLPSIL